MPFTNTQKSVYISTVKLLLFLSIDNIQSETQQPPKVNSLKGQTNQLGLCGKLTVFRLFLADVPVETNGYHVDKYGRRLAPGACFENKKGKEKCVHQRSTDMTSKK